MMQRWEYKSFGSHLLLDDILNKLGQEGWELVSVDNDNAYFKRPDRGLCPNCGQAINQHNIACPESDKGSSLGRFADQLKDRVLQSLQLRRTVKKV